MAREKDHGLFVFPELGKGPPQTCLMDGVQFRIARHIAASGVLETATVLLGELQKG